MKRFLASAVAMLLLGAASQAQAFCVYNKLSGGQRSDRFPKLWDISVTVEQGGRYKSPDLGPGKNHCCNWQDRGCNHSGRRDGTLRMRVAIVDQYKRDGFTQQNVASWAELCKIDMKAGGWLEVVFERVKVGEERRKRPDGKEMPPRPIMESQRNCKVFF